MMINKLCKDCGEKKDLRLFPLQWQICYECKSKQERARVAMRARDEFNRLVSHAPPGISAGLKRLS